MVWGLNPYSKWIVIFSGTRNFKNRTSSMLVETGRGSGGIALPAFHSHSFLMALLLNNIPIAYKVKAVCT